MKRIVRLACLMIFAAVLAATDIHAAGIVGLRGTVRIAGQETPVPNAVVRLKMVGFDAGVEQVTDKDGRFDYPWVLPGLYTVTVKSSGYRSLELEKLEVRPGHRLVMDVPLVPER